MKLEGSSQHFTTRHYFQCRQNNTTYCVKESQRSVAHITKARHGDADNDWQDCQLPSQTNRLAQTQSHGNGNGWNERSHDLIKVHTHKLETYVANGNVE